MIQVRGVSPVFWGGGGLPRSQAPTRESNSLPPKRMVMINVTIHTNRVINPQRPDKSACHTMFTKIKQVGIISLYFIVSNVNVVSTVRFCQKKLKSL